MNLQIGDIVQVDPAKEMFGGCLMVVNELTSSRGRIMAYAQIPGQGQAYLFLKEGEFERTGGKALWVIGSSKE